MPAWSCHQFFHYKRRCPIEVARTCIPHLETCSRFTLDIVIYTSEVWTATPQKKHQFFPDRSFPFGSPKLINRGKRSPFFTSVWPRKLATLAGQKTSLRRWLTPARFQHQRGSSPRIFKKVEVTKGEINEAMGCFFGVGWEMDREMVCRFDPVSLEEKSCDTHTSWSDNVTVPSGKVTY